MGSLDLQRVSRAFCEDGTSQPLRELPRVCLHFGGPLIVGCGAICGTFSHLPLNLIVTIAWVGGVRTVAPILQMRKQRSPGVDDSTRVTQL